MPNIRKIILTLLVVFAACPLSAEQVMTLEEFDGGNLDFKAGFFTDTFYGSRGDGLRMGGAVSGLDFNPSFTSYNPAVLAFLKSRTAAFGGVPLGIFNSSWITFANDEIKEMINEQLSQAFDGITLAPGVTTEVSSIDVYLEQIPMATNFELMLPFAQNQVGVAIAREEKNVLDINMMFTGLEFLVNITDDADASFDMTARAKADAVMDIDFRTIVTSYGLGRQLAPFWGIGAVLEHYQSRLYINARAEADAIATLMGNTLEYNTNDANSLSQRANADLTSDTWGLRVGTSIRMPGDVAEAAVDFAMAPTIAFKGDINVISRMIPADSQQLIDEFMAGYLTTEEQVLEGTDAQLSIKVPSYMRVSFSYKPGAVFTLNYIHYFDGFNIKYGNDYEMHMQMFNAVRLGFNFQYFQMGAGLAYARVWIKDKNVEDTQYWGVIPTASFGFNIQINPGLLSEITMFAFPFPLLKAAVAYTF